MPSITERIRRFMQSPQGRKAEQRAKEMAQSPQNREKARRFMNRFRGRH
ncbi:MAG TPA: hypothetical protein VIR33_14670 [Thermopolyspora sp.]|jgi:hypothetical protein